MADSVPMGVLYLTAIDGGSLHHNIILDYQFKHFDFRKKIVMGHNFFYCDASESHRYN